ncbi:MAG: glycoside hydrolase [Anaerolineae bacterium]|nr:glycoside hydrolase [Anaerolineae bacterium]
MPAVALWRNGFAAAAAVLAAALASITVVEAIGWSPPVKLVGTEDVRVEDTIDVALDSDALYVAWPSVEPAAGIQIAMRDLDGGWAAPFAMESPGAGRYAWSPALALRSGTVGVAWVEGITNTISNPKRVMQQDEGDPSATAVFDGAYCTSVAPDLAVGGSGWHLVFAAPQSEADCTGARINLYHAFRAAPDEPWTASSVVITHSAVLDPGAQTGGIWYPRVAVADSGATVRIVWQQRYVQTGSVHESIWMVTGTTSGTTTAWSEPVRLSPSPTDAALFVRPSLLIDEQQGVHVLWTKYLGPADQHIYYLGPSSSTSRQLNLAPVGVSNRAPRYARTSIAAQGEVVCAAWHGYVGVGLEETTLRCSDDGGVSWQISDTVSDSPVLLSVYPEIGLTATGNVHAAWAEYELGGSNWMPKGVYYRSGPPPRDDGRVFLPFVTRGK